MENAILFVDRSEETKQNNQLASMNFEYTDKETLIKMIQCVLEDNRILRQYIELLEKRNQINF